MAVVATLGATVGFEVEPALDELTSNGRAVVLRIGELEAAAAAAFGSPLAAEIAAARAAAVGAPDAPAALPAELRARLVAERVAAHKAGLEAAEAEVGTAGAGVDGAPAAPTADEPAAPAVTLYILAGGFPASEADVRALAVAGVPLEMVLELRVPPAIARYQAAERALAAAAAAAKDKKAPKKAKDAPEDPVLLNHVTGVLPEADGSAPVLPPALLALRGAADACARGEGDAFGADIAHYALHDIAPATQPASGDGDGVADARGAADARAGARAGAGGAGRPPTGDGGKAGTGGKAGAPRKGAEKGVEKGGGRRSSATASAVKAPAAAAAGAPKGGRAQTPTLSDAPGAESAGALSPWLDARAVADAVLAHARALAAQRAAYHAWLGEARAVAQIRPLADAGMAAAAQVCDEYATRLAPVPLAATSVAVVLDTIVGLVADEIARADADARGGERTAAPGAHTGALDEATGAGAGAARDAELDAIAEYLGAARALVAAGGHPGDAPRAAGATADADRLALFKRGAVAPYGDQINHWTLRAATPVDPEVAAVAAARATRRVDGGADGDGDGDGDGDADVEVVEVGEVGASDGTADSRTVARGGASPEEAAMARARAVAASVRRMFRRITVPGKNRHLMPPGAALSPVARACELSALLHACRLGLSGERGGGGGGGGGAARAEPPVDDDDGAAGGGWGGGSYVRVGAGTRLGDTAGSAGVDDGDDGGADADGDDGAVERVTFSADEAEHAAQLTALEDMVNALDDAVRAARRARAEAAAAAAGAQRSAAADRAASKAAARLEFNNRCFVERYSPEVAAQVWYKATGCNPRPTMLVEYEPGSDALLVALHTPAPPESHHETVPPTPTPLDAQLMRNFVAWDAWARRRAGVANGAAVPPRPPAPAGALLEPVPPLRPDAGTAPRCERYYPADGSHVTVTHTQQAYDDARAADVPATNASVAAATAAAAALAEAAAARGFEEKPPIARAVVVNRGWTLTVARRMTLQAAADAAGVRARALRKKPTFAQKTVFFSDEDFDPPIYVGDVEVLLACHADGGSADGCTLRVHLEPPTAHGTVWLTHGDAHGCLTSISQDGEVRVRWARPASMPAAATSGHAHARASSQPLELARTILTNGAVVSHCDDGSAVMMLRDGNVAVRRADGSMDVTNSFGVRVRRAPAAARRGATAAAADVGADGRGAAQYSTPLPQAADDLSYLPMAASANLSDRESGTTLLTRTDRVCTASLADGRTVALHADGTHVACSADVEAFHGARGEIVVEGGPCAAGPAAGRVRLNLRTDEQSVECAGRTRLRRVLDPETTLLVLVADRPDGSQLVVHAHATKRRARAPTVRFVPPELALTERVAYDDEGTYNVKLGTAELRVRDVEGSTFVIRVGRPAESRCEPAPIDDFAEGDDAEATAERKRAAAELVAGAARAREAGEVPSPRPTLERTRRTPATGGSHPPRLFCFRPDGSCIEWLRPIDVAPYVAAVGASYAFPLSPPLHKGLLALGPTDGGTVVVSSPVSRSPPSSYVTLLSTDLDELAAVAPSAILQAEIAHLFEFSAAFRPPPPRAHTVRMRQLLFTAPLDGKARRAFVQVVRQHVQLTADSFNQLQALRLVDERDDDTLALEAELAEAVEARERELADEAASDELLKPPRSIRSGGPRSSGTSRHDKGGRGFSFSTLNVAASASAP